MKRLIACMAVLVTLTGCADQFVGTYKYGDGSTLTVNKDGTCENITYSNKSACTWKRTGEGLDTIDMKTWMGTVVFDIAKKSDSTYEMSAMGFTDTLVKQ